MAYQNRAHVKKPSTRLRLTDEEEQRLQDMAEHLGLAKAVLVRDLTLIGLGALEQIVGKDGDDLAAHFGISPTSLVSQLLHESLSALKESVDSDKPARRRA